MAPTNSLVQLAKDASFHPGYGDANNHTTNGDGFGVGKFDFDRIIINGRLETIPAHVSEEPEYLTDFMPFYTTPI